MDSAILTWIQQFNPSVSTLSALSDGLEFSRMLTGFSPSWFKPQSSNQDTSWVYKFNTLKRLHKLILSFLDNHGIKPSLVINCNAIAKDSSNPDILNFAILVLVVAVQCEENVKYVTQIQQLDKNVQKYLMMAIEDAISSKGQQVSPVDSLDQERTIEKLKAENAELRSNYAVLVDSKSSSDSGLGPVLQKTQDALQIAEEKIENQSRKIIELEKNLAGKEEQMSEYAKLKDQVDEFRHLADTLQKTQALNEKYKRKLDDALELKKKVALLEEENTQLRQSQSQIEQETKKLKSYKPILDSYKEEIKLLEEKNSTLMVEASKVEFEIREYQVRIERLENEKKAVVDLNNSLEDRLREAELGGDIIGESLAGELNSTPNEQSTVLRRKISSLERQLDKYKTSSSITSENRISMLENLLDDSNMLKSKFEKDYLNLYQRNLQLEKQLEQLSSESGNKSLQFTLEEKESEIEALREQLKAPVQAEVDHTRCKSQLTQSETQLRISQSKINKLNAEKEVIVEQLVDLKDRLLSEQKSSGELRALIAGLEVSRGNDDESQSALASATHKLVQIQQQNEALHQALKQAKERIVGAEKQKGGSGDVGYPEAIAAFEATIKEKDLEIARLVNELKGVRIAVAREQRLMASAYQSLGFQVQRYANAGKGGASWLAMQRKGMEFKSPQ